MISELVALVTTMTFWEQIKGPDDELIESSMKSLSLQGLSRKDVQTSTKTAKNKNKENFGFKIRFPKRTFYFSVHDRGHSPYTIYIYIYVGMLH